MVELAGELPSVASEPPAYPKLVAEPVPEPVAQPMAPNQTPGAFCLSIALVSRCEKCFVSFLQRLGCLVLLVSPVPCIAYSTLHMSLGQILFFPFCLLCYLLYYFVYSVSVLACFPTVVLFHSCYLHGAR